MKTYKNILQEHGLSVEEVMSVEREMRLCTYASIFNRYMKKNPNGITDEIPQKMLEYIHDDFDDEREEAEWHNDNLFLEFSDFEKAIEFVKDNIDMKRVSRVKAKLESKNMELAYIDEELDETIYDLMEEYGADNNLPEGWWENEATTEDIVKQL